MTELERDHLRDCVRTLTTNFPCNFTLVGGAAMIQLGEYYVAGGVLYINPPSSSPSAGSPIKLDILTGILEEVTLDDLAGYTTVVGGITMLTLPVNLAVKIRCWYSRAEDENGLRKKRTDLEDILFLAKSMQAQGVRVRRGFFPEGLRICHYNPLLVRFEITKAETQLLLDIGCSDFLKEYDDNTEDQRELYELMGAGAGTNPLTVELEDEEEF
ncbi:MAG: hypothetical protein M1839_002462 [Geoglossum umbratile]|nr:MAG: hypothetical protein M1839_002462 [Geoglossum umbratile]